MPLEIKELHIKVSVTEGEKQGGGGSPSGGSGEEGIDAIVRACVEKVLEILKDKTER